ncbi:unnamed protein product [Debaryomyces fabryi]|nr:unnamed protein product [Debaryomyces fabryi]
MDHSVSGQTEMMFDLSRGDLLKPSNSRGNPIYRLPLNQTDLENYKNTRYSKNSPYASRNETPLSSDKPNGNCKMDTEESKENKSKENIYVNAKGNKIFYEKKRDTLLHRQPLESSVATARSSITSEFYHTKLKPNIEKQDLCTTLLSDLLNPESISRSVLILNQPLADENSKLDLSTLPKRQNTLAAPFCNEANSYEEVDDDSMLLNLLTEEIKSIDKDYKEASASRVPVLRKFLNGLKYYFPKYEARQRRRINS